MKNNLTINEKAKLLVLDTTFETANVNDTFFNIKMSDGPVGLRMPIENYLDGKLMPYCLPSISMLASTFNEHLSYQYGQVIASQCIDNNVDIILAPAVNIKRSPLCGRNFEYFSEDPYLTGMLASNYVNGVQDLGIGTSLKHFCCNNKEYDRLFVSSEVDYRTIREIYSKQFEMIIKNCDPWTIMCSYNAINGINVSENKYILNDLLREKLNYKNVIISDWGAVHNRIDALKAGLDIQCPEDKNAIEMIIDAYNNKIISDEEINESIDRIERLCNKVKENRHKRVPLDEKTIKEVCINTIIEGAVLLKNDNNLLPLNNSKSIAIFGEGANNPYYCGGGSAQVYLENKMSSLQENLIKQLPNCKITYERVFGLQKQGVSIFNLRKCYELAYDSDVAILVVGNNNFIESEGYDRVSIKLDEQVEEIINEVAKHNKNSIVIVEAGSIIDMSNWIDNVSSVIYTGFGGSYINEALALILTGKANPSGRLSETIPYSLMDTPTASYRGNGYVDVYNEGILVGYRWYDSNGIDVLFPFGYGLSYSKFEYENIKIKNIDKTNYEISLDVINSSNIKGSDVILLFVSNIDMKVFKAKKDLKRFVKVSLMPHERKTITINVNSECFEYFNVCLDSWHVDEGRYELILAKSATDYIKVFKIKI